MDFRSRSKSFEKLAIAQIISAGMSTGQGEPQVVWGMLVSASFLSTMQVAPAVGRDFRPDEDEVQGRSPVAVISYALWGRSFGSDPGVVGRQVKLNGHVFTIVGVAPKSFTGPDLFFRPDIYVPNMMTAALTQDGTDMLTHRSYRGFNMMGRLRAGVTVKQAQAELDTIMRDLERAYPDTNKDATAYVRKEMDRRLIGNGVLLPSILMALVLLVLLIACANVASLLMARATSRMREISTQLAIGATRAALVRQLLPRARCWLFSAGFQESYLDSDASGIHGPFALHAFAVGPCISPGRSSPGFRSPGVHRCSVSLWTGSSVSDIREAMASVTTNVRAGVSDSRTFGMLARRILIAGQIALSTILLIGGGLFLKAFVKAQRVDLGFNPSHVLLVSIDPSLRGYSAEKAVLFNQQLLRQTAGLPGVKSASIASSVPFLSGASWDISIDGYTTASGERFVDTATNQVAPGYFAAMQIPLLRGREFTEHDNASAPLTVIVNETLARRYIVGNGDLDKAIGHNIQLRDHDRIRS